MRTTLELLELMFVKFVTAQNNDNKHGLCWFTRDLFNKDLITRKEERRLDKVIDNNRPTGTGCFGYFWDEDDSQVRIDYLQSLIEKYKQ